MRISACLLQLYRAQFSQLPSILTQKGSRELFGGFIIGRGLGLLTLFFALLFLIPLLHLSLPV